MSLWISGVGRFIYGHEALIKGDIELAALGRRPLVVCGEKAFEAAKEPLLQFLADHQLVATFMFYQGYCSKCGHDHVIQTFRNNGSDMVVAVGGGKIMDLCKYVAATLCCPLITIPTSVATCAAWTPFSVLYTQQGIPIGSVHHTQGVNLCIADYDVLTKEPNRLLAAGMVDSLAKEQELICGASNMDLQPGQSGLYAAYQLSKVIKAVTMQQGVDAWQCVSKHTCNAALIDIFYSNLALTGMCSGLAQGTKQLALAHAVNNGLRTLHPQFMSDVLHGESVGIGIVVQQAYNGTTASDYLSLCNKLSMPVCLKDIQYPIDQDTFSFLLCFVLKALDLPDNSAQAKRVACALKLIF